MPAGRRRRPHRRHLDAHCCRRSARSGRARASTAEGRAQQAVAGPSGQATCLSSWPWTRRRMRRLDPIEANSAMQRPVFVAGVEDAVSGYRLEIDV